MSRYLFVLQVGIIKTDGEIHFRTREFLVDNYTAGHRLCHQSILMRDAFIDVDCCKARTQEDIDLWVNKTLSKVKGIRPVLRCYYYDLQEAKRVRNYICPEEILDQFCKFVNAPKVETISDNYDYHDYDTDSDYYDE